MWRVAFVIWNDMTWRGIAHSHIDACRWRSEVCLLPCLQAKHTVHITASQDIKLSNI